MATERPARRSPPSGGTKRPTVREGSRKRYEERRLELIDAATQVFAKRGYHGATIDDLVEATGLQRGGLYHYIDSKEDLIVQIHGRFIEPLLEEARRIDALGEPADVTLRNLAHALMHDIVTYLDEVTVFLHEWKFFEHHPAWADVREKRREFERVVQSVIERGIEEGVFVVEDVRLAVLAFLGMFNYSYQWLRPDGRATADQVADRFCDYFMKGIAA